MNVSIVWPVLTFLVGGFLGGFVMVRVARKDYERRINELEYENAYMGERLQISTSKNEQLLDQMGEIVDRTYEELKADNANYTKLSRKYKDDDFDRHFAERVGPEDDPPLRGPFAISEEDFDILGEETSTACLRFYQKDEVLTDEDDIILDDPEEAIGAEVIEALSDTDEDMMFVQNDMHGVIYEIAVEHGLSYHYDVLGEEELS